MGYTGVGRDDVIWSGNVGAKAKEPVEDSDLTRKDYVDGLTADHPHQDVKTIATPTFNGLISTDQISLSKDGDNIITASRVAGNLRLGAGGMTSDLIIDTGGNVNIGENLNVTKDITATGDIDCRLLTSTFSQAGQTKFEVSNTNAGAGASAGFKAEVNGGSFEFFAVGTGGAIGPFPADSAVYVAAGLSNLIFATNTFTYASSPGTDKLVMNSTLADFHDLNMKTTGDIDLGGDLTFTGVGRGLPYGSFYGNEFNQSQAMTQNVEYQVSHADIATGQSNNITTDGNGKFTITKAGKYQVLWSITAEHSAVGKHILWGIALNQVLQADAQQHRETVATSKEYNLSGNGIIDVAVGEDIEIGFKSDDGTPGTALISHMSLTVTQVGG